MSNRKIEIRVLSVARGRFPNNAFNVLLEEIEFKNRFEIIIGYFEANSIGVALEQQKSARPMTHDLIINILFDLKAEVKEVIINNLIEGVFFASIILEANGFVYEIDSRTSDALAIALRANCPIFTYESILNQVVKHDELTSLPKYGSQKSNKNIQERDELAHLSIEELEEMLNNYLNIEEYERAALIRDEIERRNK